MCRDCGEIGGWGVVWQLAGRVTGCERSWRATLCTRKSLKHVGTNYVEMEGAQRSKTTEDDNGALTKLWHYYIHNTPSTTIQIVIYNTKQTQRPIQQNKIKKIANNILNNN